VDAGLPAHWEPIDPSHGNSTLILLDPANKPHHAAELAEVTQNFTATGGHYNIETCLWIYWFGSIVRI